MSEHTPGPWVVHETRLTEYDVARTVNSTTGSGLVFESLRGWNHIPNPADARLIAAAPDLYKALLELGDVVAASPHDADVAAALARARYAVVAAGWTPRA